VDGIYLNRNTVVLIARSDRHVLGWYLARSENSFAWSSLMRRIAAPEVVVTDGGTGFEKARREVWPQTRVQRCTFHAFRQVRRYTTAKSRLPAGVELYGLAKRLLHIKTLFAASSWVEEYMDWSFRWKDFLNEYTIIEGRKVFTHQRLKKAKRGLDKLINKELLFTYLDPDLTREGPLPATNNKIEGGVIRQLRDLIRDHRGMSLTRRIKAVFWWCYMKTEDPLSPAELLRTMPTDEDVEGLFRSAEERLQWRNELPGLGTAVVWEDLHLSGPRPLDWN